MAARAGPGTHPSTCWAAHTLAHPILAGPVAFQRMAHPDGELATGLRRWWRWRGLVLSTQASVSLESVAQARLPATRARPPVVSALSAARPRLYPGLVQRRKPANYEALVLTVDAPPAASATGTPCAAFAAAQAWAR